MTAPVRVMPGMISPNASPIRHASPYKRIDLGSRPAGDPNVAVDIATIAALIEQNRIWQLVRQAAGAGE